MSVQVLGIIPARGGSKGISGKNLVSVGGRPLLAYTADAAHASRRLSRTIITTDDETIAQAARDLRIEVPFMRPDTLAGDDTPMLPVVQHALRAMRAHEIDADVVVLLQPTSPLRRGEHIDRAIELLAETGADSVVSVVDVPHQFNPVSVLSLDGDRLRPFLDTAPTTRRQDKPPALARNGPAVLAVRAAVIEGGSLYGQDSRPLMMAPEDSIDVDTLFDLHLVELLLRERQAG